MSFAGNLTGGSLPRVCSEIQNVIAQENGVPKECADFVGSSMTVSLSFDTNLSAPGISPLPICTSLLWKAVFHEVLRIWHVTSHKSDASLLRFVFA